MRVFLAGASGVIGRRLVPLLTARGDVVAGMTRTPGKVDDLRALGAEPVLCDVFDAPAVARVVRNFAPDLVLHELTDLPDDAALLGESARLNARIRREGTANLLAAARAAGVRRFVAQSVAWQVASPVGAAAVAELERSVLDFGGVVMRYGQFYGPGTYYESVPPAEPRVEIGRAAELTVEHLGDPSGVATITD